MGKFRIITAVVALLAGACAWPMAGYGPDHRGFSRFERTITPENFDQVVPGWSRPGGTGEVVGDHDTVFVRGHDLVVALDHDTGAERWRGTFPGDTVPALAGDRLVVATGGSHCAVTSVRAIDGGDPRSTGIGGPDLGGAGSSSCTVTSDVVLDGDTAVVSWSYSGFSPNPGCPQGTTSVSTGFTGVSVDGSESPISVSEQKSFCGASPPGFAAPTKFGTVTRTTSHYLTVHGPNVTAYPLTCPTTCPPAWSVTPPAKPDERTIALPGDRGDVVRINGRVSVLDDTTGATRWSTTGLAGAVAANDQFVFTVLGELGAYPIAGCGTPTCGPAWTASIGDVSGAGRPSVAGDLLLVPTLNGGAVFDARGCGGTRCTAVSLNGPSSYLTPSTVIAGRIFIPTPQVLATAAPPEA